VNTKSSRSAEILAVGSELLTPQHIDTNSLYLTERLNELGFEVSFKTVVGDDAAAIGQRIKQALRHSALVILSGGLGPTGDDRTREAVAAALHRKLVFRKDLLRRIEERFRRRDIPMPASSRKQAYLIRGAAALPNNNGTAAGQWIQTGERTLVLLPGPPHELRAMFDDSVFPRLEEGRRGYLVRRVFKTAGLTESQVEAHIADLYPNGDDRDITVLAAPGQIEIHLTSFSPRSRLDAERRLRPIERELRRRLAANIFSQSGERLEEVVGRLLKEKNKTLAVAESCSGGLLSHRLTNVPGSSDYFLEGVVVYSNAAKVRRLGVRNSVIREHGAVSVPVALAMAGGIRRRARSDFGLSITGIAGPAGGSPGKPVGLVYVGLAWAGGGEVAKNLFLGNRELVKNQSTQKALDMLRRHLLQNDFERKGNAE
jgi:nicotinamide-nucleotide amidase